MLRYTFFLAFVLVGSMACDRDPEQPRGGAWQPCLENRRCSDDTMVCQQAWGASDVTFCAPTCRWGDTCASPPPNSDNLATSARCTATESSTAGICMVDCSSEQSCPADMLCFFDDAYTPETGLGICAWPPV